MGGAIWAILYDLSPDDRDAYLDWFHDIHIPEKLARPGYVSAGHYAVVGADGAPGSITGAQGERNVEGYIALFGGKDTSVFLNPSPAQIKPNQPHETRIKMGRRIGSRSFIAATEWVEGEALAGHERGDAAIVLTCCDTPGQDENFGAYCVQDLKPALAQNPGFRSLTKLLAAVGPMKHATIASFSSLESAAKARTMEVSSDWAKRIAGAQSQIPGSPFLAKRVWPAV